MFPGFLTPVLKQLSFPEPPTTFLTCLCRSERLKYAGKKVRLNRGSNSQPPDHESDTLTTEPPGLVKLKERFRSIVITQTRLLQNDFFGGKKFSLSDSIDPITALFDLNLNYSQKISGSCLATLGLATFSIPSHLCIFCSIFSRTGWNYWRCLHGGFRLAREKWHWACASSCPDVTENLGQSQKF